MKRAIIITISWLFVVSSLADGLDNAPRPLGNSVKSVSQAMLPSVFKGEVELRHQMNSYYDSDGFLLRQEPSLQLRGKFGFSAYQGLMDVYAAVGVIKLSETLRVIQKRPELAIDIYPVSNEYILINQYHLLELPFSEADYDSRNAYAERQGTVYRPGLATTAFMKWATPVAALKLKAGVDLWTEMYSRNQFHRHEKEINGHFALVKDPETQQPVTRKAPSLYSEFMLNVGVRIPWLAGIESDIGLYYDNFFHEAVNAQELKPSRESFLKWSLVYKVKPGVVFSNDLVRYHESFLGDRVTGDKRTFRNIVRITQAL